MIKDSNAQILAYRMCEWTFLSSTKFSVVRIISLLATGDLGQK